MEMRLQIRIGVRYRLPLLWITSDAPGTRCTSRTVITALRMTVAAVRELESTATDRQINSQSF